MSDTEYRLDKITITTHWIIAVAIIGMLVFGLYLENLPRSPGKGSLIQIHKAIGVIVLLVASFRFARRIVIGFPPHVFGANYKMYDIIISKATYWVLLIGMIAMPISGMVMSLAGGHDINVFGIVTIPGFEVENESLAAFARNVHAIGSKILIAAIILHLAGAFKHHLIDKDNALRRMLGKSVS